MEASVDAGYILVALAYSRSHFEVAQGEGADFGGLNSTEIHASEHCEKMVEKCLAEGYRSCLVPAAVVVVDILDFVRAMVVMLIRYLAENSYGTSQGGAYVGDACAPEGLLVEASSYPYHRRHHLDRPFPGNLLDPCVRGGFHTKKQC